LAEPLNQQVNTRTLVILAFSATAGVLVEFYDFSIFGFATASAFPQIFFPHLPPARALLFSYLALGAGYPARILGHAVPIILLATVSAFQLMDSVVSGTYAISFMRFAGIPLATTATIIFLSRIGDVLGVLVSGPLADLKRRSVAYLAIGLTTLLSYPSALAILHKQIQLVMLLQFLITFLGLGLLHGLVPILMSESFPTKFRYSGTGLSFSLAAVHGGMVPPPLLARLIGQDVLHKWLYLPVIYVVYCAAAMLALHFIPETRDLKMEDIDREQSQALFGATLQGGAAV
jgi:MFS family permease